MRQLKWRPRRSRAKLPLVRDLAFDIWQLDDDIQDHKLKAYRDHYHDSKKLLLDDNVRINGVTDVVNLVAALKAHPESSIKDIKHAISRNQQSFLTKTYNDASILAALSFALRLWLFVPVDGYLADEDELLKDLLERKLRTSVPSGPASAATKLSHDLCEKSLTRKAGVRLVWTSDLSEHLQLFGKSTLKIFRHVSALHTLADAEAGEFFPPGFLTETENTIALLFPEVNYYDSQRNRRIGEKHNVDIEVGLPVSFDLSDYPFWRQRLSDLQLAYDEARPKRVKQWYFDRRNKEAWTTLWIAVIVFFFTLFFGIISSVTGIMQVYIAFKTANTAQASVATTSG